MKAKPTAQKNRAGGYDLFTERDSGNGVLILTGKKSSSKEYWQNLFNLAAQVMNEIDADASDMPQEITV